MTSTRPAQVAARQDAPRGQRPGRSAYVISVDQHLGSHADPTSSGSSGSSGSSVTMVPAFAAALITAAPLAVFLRNVDRPGSEVRGR